MIRTQSPAAYPTLQATGVLQLPGETTLASYTNVIQPRICKQTKDFQENEKWVVLLHDEMSLKSDLVYDRRSGELVGFLDPKNWRFEKNFKIEDQLATHVVCFMVVGVNTSLKTTLGYFSSRTAIAEDIYPYFWKAVGHLENFCKLKVIKRLLRVRCKCMCRCMQYYNILEKFTAKAN